MGKIKGLYEKSKNAKIGDECNCPSCGTKFIKKTKQQAFCKTKGGTRCKDKYWNTITPEKRCNTTRISPASAAYMATRLELRAERRGFPDVEEMLNYVDEGRDALSCEVEPCPRCGLRYEYCRCEDN